MSNFKIDPAIGKIIYNHNEIKSAVKKCANWINKETSKTREEYILIGILKGCAPFIGHLLPLIKGKIILDFFNVSSYLTGTVNTMPKIILDLSNNVENKNVILVEDVIDTGSTLKFLIGILKQRKVKSIKLVSLFEKIMSKKQKIDIEYYSPLKLPNEWIVGYGLDCGGYWRNLPYVGTLKKEYRKS